MMATEDPPEVGNWVKQRVLGSGGFGVVTLWKNKTTDETIALKKCRCGADNLMTQKHKERWSKEVEIMQRLSHPNVVKAIEVPSDLAALRSELPLLCMEFCSKGDLRQILNRSENCCGLKEADVRALVSDVKSAIQYLHSMKITHRDLKPENIVLQQREKKIVYKLIDLGYAKELDQSSLCTSFVGTLQYLAPELFTNKPYTSSVDYWSLGLVSHEVITGVRPFLPNMTPAGWMTHVRNKSSDHINAYQAPDGTIVFSDQIYEQNHISLALKHDMEHWLKIALEWDPKKRGRGPDDKVIVFNLLEEILAKKVVQVFVLPKYAHCSYEVDSSTELSTLQVWIERDVQLPVAEQELLLPSGKPPLPAFGAMQCWNAQFLEDGTPMLFVFKKGSLSLPQVIPRMPWTVQNMMGAPEEPLEYVHLRRAWAHACFFLHQETELYDTFIAACRCKLRHIMEVANNISENLQDANNKLHIVEELFDLVHSSLNLDRERGSVKVPGPIMQRWLQVYDEMELRITKLREVIQQLQTKAKSASSKLSLLRQQQTPHRQEMLSVLSEAGLKCYDNLRRRPREERQRKSDSQDMARIVYNCLKQRDALLRDQNFGAYLVKVSVTQQDLEMLCGPLNKALQLIDKVCTELKQAQLDRQKDIWAIVGGLGTLKKSTNNTSSEQNLQSCDVPGMVIPEIRIGNSLSPQPDMLMTSMGDDSLTPTPMAENGREQPLSFDRRISRETTPTLSMGHVSPTILADTADLVKENFEMRYITQELMTQSFQQFKSIMDECLSMDWSLPDQ